MRLKSTTIVALLVLLLVPQVALADAGNPCGGKAMNPCGGKAMNPCGEKATVSSCAMPAVNPCHAKMGTVFYIADPMQRNTVTFKSEAPLEDIVGTTNQISGYVVMDPANPDQGGRGKIIVPVAGLNTGIPLRDEHLRGADWLDAENYPTIELQIDEVKDIEVVKESSSFTTYSMTLVGAFSLHGKTKKMRIPATVTFLPHSKRTESKLPGDLLAGRASFEVSLKDFGVKGFDGAIGSKVGETIGLDVSFTATNDKPAEVNAGNPCGGKTAKHRS